MGQGANEFANEMGVQTVSRDSLVTQEAKQEYENYVNFQRSVHSNFGLREKLVLTVNQIKKERELAYCDRLVHISKSLLI